jgi:hypothetical protein
MTGPGLSLHNLYYQTHSGAAKAALARAGALLAGLLLASSCTPTTPPAAPVGAPTGPVTATGPAAVVPAGPVPMPLSSAEARSEAGATALAPGAAATVEPASTFEVRIASPVRGARLVLLDPQDLVVPATVESEVGPSGSRFTLVPQEPLRPGGAYLLRLEGLDGRLVRSAGDGIFEPLALPLRVSGTPPPRAPPKKAKKKRPA